MSQFMTIHRAPGMSQEEFQQNTSDVVASKHAQVLNVYVNMFEGFIVTYYEAESEAMLVKEFERLGFPHDEVHEIQMAFTREQLEQMAAGDH